MALKPDARFLQECGVGRRRVGGAEPDMQSSDVSTAMIDRRCIQSEAASSFRKVNCRLSRAPFGPRGCFGCSADDFDAEKATANERGQRGEAAESSPWRVGAAAPRVRR